MKYNTRHHLFRGISIRRIRYDVIVGKHEVIWCIIEVLKFLLCVPTQHATIRTIEAHQRERPLHTHKAHTLPHAQPHHGNMERETVLSNCLFLRVSSIWKSCSHTSWVWLIDIRKKQFDSLSSVLHTPHTQEKASKWDSPMAGLQSYSHLLFCDLLL